MREPSRNEHLSATSLQHASRERARVDADGKLPQSHENGSRALLSVRPALRELARRIGQLLTGVALSRKFAVLQHLVTEMHEELRQTQVREHQARHLAFHDDLTSLPNRRFFRERLSLAVQGATALPALAVIYLDLDGFKKINDTCGHSTGDALLASVAARIGSTVREGDLVSRLGGDEFACLISGVSEPDRLRQIVSTLFAAISTPFQIGCHTLTVRPSIGLAVYPSDGVTPDALMNAADIAMYRAKRAQSAGEFPDLPVTALPSPASCSR